VILPRNAILARYMLSSFMCPSVRRHTSYCVKMAKLRITEITPHDSAGTLNRHIRSLPAIRSTACDVTLELLVRRHMDVGEEEEVQTRARRCSILLMAPIVGTLNRSHTPSVNSRSCISQLYSPVAVFSL